MKAPANAAGAEAPRYFRAPLADFGGARPPAPDWFERAVEDAPERSTVEVQGAAIETLAWGRIGDPGLLLMHGNGAHADWFSFIAPSLAREGRRVVAMSFSGMGRSGWRDKYSVAQWSDETIAVVEAATLLIAAATLGPLPVKSKLISSSIRSCRRVAPLRRGRWRTASREPRFAPTPRTGCWSVDWALRSMRFRGNASSR